MRDIRGGGTGKNILMCNGRCEQKLNSCYVYMFTPIDHRHDYLLLLYCCLFIFVAHYWPLFF